jgi:2-keto-4-pentenoate hydratase/2-oxohepta-3-ene-1,7-dioic acid hydratase in catechol pathway
VLASVWYGGSRCAAVVDGSRVGLTPVPGLEEAIAGKVDVGAEVRRWVDADEVRFDAPIRPPVVFCLGQTYRSHVAEKGMAGYDPADVPDQPEFFLKAGQTIAAPDEPHWHDPASVRKLDYETELAVVIGKPARRVDAGDALDYVYGYTVLNDLSDRARQVVTDRRGHRRMAADAGKNFDGATRLAAAVVPAREVPDVGRLEISTTVNGQRRQLDNVANLLFGVPEQIAYLSCLLTLRPGSVIATGTPGGTGWSADTALGGTGIIPPGCVPARYLAIGDEVTSTVAGVATLSFTVQRAG